MHHCPLAHKKKVFCAMKKRASEVQQTFLSAQQHVPVETSIDKTSLKRKITSSANQKKSKYDRDEDSSHQSSALEAANPEKICLGAHSDTDAIEHLEKLYIELQALVKLGIDMASQRANRRLSSRGAAAATRKALPPVHSEELRKHIFAIERLRDEASSLIATRAGDSDSFNEIWLRMEAIRADHNFPCSAESVDEAEDCKVRDEITASEPTVIVIPPPSLSPVASSSTAVDNPADAGDVLNEIESLSHKIADALTTKFIDLSVEQISKGFYVYIENVLPALSPEALMTWKASLPKTGWLGIQKIEGDDHFRKGHYRFQIPPDTKSFPRYPGLDVVDAALGKLFTGKDDRVTQYYLKSVEGVVRQFWHADNASLVNCFNRKTKPITDKMQMMSPFKLTYSAFVAFEEYTTLHVADDWTVDGEVKMIRDKKAMRIKPGDMLIMTSNCLHAGDSFTGVTAPPEGISEHPAYKDHFRGFFEISTSLAPIYSNSQYWFLETGNRYSDDPKRQGWVQAPPFYYRNPERRTCREHDSCFPSGTS